jgi:hypothetical protein
MSVIAEHVSVVWIHATGLNSPSAATSGRSCCAQYFQGTFGFSPPICKIVVLSSGNHHVHH